MGVPKQRRTRHRSRIFAASRPLTLPLWSVGEQNREVRRLVRRRAASLRRTDRGRFANCLVRGATDNRRVNIWEGRVLPRGGVQDSLAVYRRPGACTAKLAQHSPLNICCEQERFAPRVLHS